MFRYLSKEDKLKDYRLESFLGHDGLCAYYLSQASQTIIKEYFPQTFAKRHPQHPQLLATDVLAYEEALVYFRRESLFLSQHPHLGLAKILDRFDEHGTAYVIMPYEKGLSLKDYVSGQRIDLVESMGLLEHIPQALNYLLKQDLPFKISLSPDSFWVTLKDHEPKAYLQDLGILNHHLNRHQPDEMALSAYPPEQAAIYGLAALLFWLNTQEKFSKDGPWPNSLNPLKIPLEKAFNLKNPYQSLKDFWQDCEKALKIIPTSVTIPLTNPINSDKIAVVSPIISSETEAKEDPSFVKASQNTASTQVALEHDQKAPEQAKKAQQSNHFSQTTQQKISPKTSQAKKEAAKTLSRLLQTAPNPSEAALPSFEAIIAQSSFENINKDIPKEPSSKDQVIQETAIAESFRARPESHEKDLKAAAPAIMLETSTLSSPVSESPAINPAINPAIAPNEPNETETIATFQNTQVEETVFNLENPLTETLGPEIPKEVRKRPSILWPSLAVILLLGILLVNLFPRRTQLTNESLAGGVSHASNISPNSTASNTSSEVPTQAIDPPS
ncbi:MAG: hypothetical protein R2880_00370 [Deinococcales bacterium]